MAIVSTIGVLVLYIMLLGEYRDRDIIIKRNESAKKEEQRRKEVNRQIDTRNNEIKKKNEKINTINEKNERNAIAEYNRKKNNLNMQIKYSKELIKYLELQFEIWRDELKISAKLCQAIDDEKTLISLCDCYDMVKCNIHTRSHNFEEV